MPRLGRLGGRLDGTPRVNLQLGAGQHGLAPSLQSQQTEAMPRPRFRLALNRDGNITDISGTAPSIGTSCTRVCVTDISSGMPLHRDVPHLKMTASPREHEAVQGEKADVHDHPETTQCEKVDVQDPRKLSNARRHPPLTSRHLMTTRRRPPHTRRHLSRASW